MTPLEQMKAMAARESQYALKRDGSANFGFQQSVAAASRQHRQKRMRELILQGKTVSEIAEAVGVSHSTALRDVRTIKLDLERQAQ